MAGRGQISIELFFAMLLFIVSFLWFSNYAGVFASDFGLVSARSQASAIAGGLAKVSSSACVYHTNVSLQLPCVSRSGGERLGVILSAGNSTIINASIAGEEASVEAVAICPVTVAFSFACTNGTAGDWVCVRGATGTVSISRGKC